eukprot:133678-Prymnesium_polylepis.1
MKPVCVRCARSDLHAPDVQLALLSGGGVPLHFADGLGPGRENFEENALLAIPLDDVHPPIPAACAWDEWGDSQSVGQAPHNCSTDAQCQGSRRCVVADPAA